MASLAGPPPSVPRIEPQTDSVRHLCGHKRDATEICAKTSAISKGVGSFGPLIPVIAFELAPNQSLVVKWSWPKKGSWARNINSRRLPAVIATARRRDERGGSLTC